MADEPRTDTANLDGLVLLLAALEREGRTPTVVARSVYDADRVEDRWPTDPSYDYVVVEDATWRAWRDTDAPVPRDRDA